jgi:trk system potassium uptake protein TrkH
MLIGTVMLLAFGMGSFLVLEWRGTLSEVPYWKRPLVALFHSVTCRTAGFNTVDMARLTNATLFTSILLMMIGAGPGSTAGGFKVSTLGILALRAWASLRGREKINVFRRTIPRDAVIMAMVTAMLFAAVATIALTVLLAFEQSQQPHIESKGLFLDAAFEVISALGTVGLSTGLTGGLNNAGRVIIMLLMFIGRLGPITVFAALSRSEQREAVEFSNEEPLVG